MLFLAKQERIVLEYVEEFERLSAPLREASEEYLIGAFRNGLRAEVKVELRLTNALSLREVIESALCVEERNRILEEDKGPHRLGFQRYPSGPKTN